MSSSRSRSPIRGCRRNRQAGETNLDGETTKNSEQGAAFARTVRSRLNQVLSKHDEILENLDRTDKFTARTKGSLESTMNKKMESTEQAWNKNVNFQEIMEKMEMGRVPCMAAATRAAERWTEYEDGRFSRAEAVTEWEGTVRKMEETEKRAP